MFMGIKLKNIEYKYDTHDIVSKIATMIQGAEKQILIISNHKSFLETKIRTQTLQELLLSQQNDKRLDIQCYFYDDVDYANIQDTKKEKAIQYTILNTTNPLKTFINDLKQKAREYNKKLKTEDFDENDIFCCLSHIEFRDFKELIDALQESIIRQFESYARTYSLSKTTKDETIQHTNKAFTFLLESMESVYSEGNAQLDKNFWILVVGLCAGVLLLYIGGIGVLTLALTSVDVAYQLCEYHKNNTFFKKNQFYLPLAVPIIESFFTQVSYTFAICLPRLTSHIIICDKHLIDISSTNVEQDLKFIPQEQLAMCATFVNDESKNIFLNLINGNMKDNNLRIHSNFIHQEKAIMLIQNNAPKDMQQNQCFNILQSHFLGNVFIGLVYIQHPIFSSEALARIMAHTKIHNDTSKTSRNYLIITNTPTKMNAKTIENIYTSKDLLNFTIKGRKQTNEQQSIKNPSIDYSQYDLEQNFMSDDTLDATPHIVPLTPFCRIKTEEYKKIAQINDNYQREWFIPIFGLVNVAAIWHTYASEIQSYRHISQFFTTQVQLDKINNSIQNIRDQLLKNTIKYCEIIRDKNKKDISRYKLTSMDIFFMSVYFTLLKTIDYSLEFKGEFLTIIDNQTQKKKTINYGIMNKGDSQDVIFTSKGQKYASHNQDTNIPNLCIEETVEQLENSTHSSTFTFENMAFSINSHELLFNIFEKILDEYYGEELGDLGKDKKDFVEIIQEISLKSLKDSLLLLFPLPQFFINDSMQDILKNATKILIIIAYTYSTRNDQIWKEFFGVFAQHTRKIYKHLIENIPQYDKKEKNNGFKHFKGHYHSLISASNSTKQAIQKIASDFIHSISPKMKLSFGTIIAQYIIENILKNTWQTTFESMQQTYNNLIFAISEKYDPPYAKITQEYVYFPLINHTRLIAFDFSKALLGGELCSGGIEFFPYIMSYVHNDSEGIKNLCLKNILAFIVYDLFREALDLDDREFMQMIFAKTSISSADILIYSLDSNVNKKWDKALLDYELKERYKNKREYGNTVDMLHKYNEVILYLAEQADSIANVSISPRDLVEALRSIGKHNIEAMYHSPSNEKKQKPIIGRLATTIIQDNGLWLG